MIKYCFDGYINNRACGWVADLSTPGKKLHIALIVSNEIISVCEASEYRKDLEVAGIADGKFGFTIALPDMLEGDCHLQIVELQKTIKESSLHIKLIDVPASLLFSAKDFSRYLQFMGLPRLRGVYGAPAKSARLARGMGQCKEERAGMPIPQHAAWVIERNRRGGPQFFTTPTESAWSDLAWYFFDYHGEDKMLFDITLDNPLVQRLAQAPFNELSPLYVAWLLRNSQQVEDISKVTDKQKCEFLGRLLSSNMSIPSYPELETLKRPISKRPRKTKIKNLPRLSKYLNWKYEVGYSQNYQFDSDAGYLSYIFDVALHATAFELEYLGKEVEDFLKDEVLFSDGRTSRFEFITWLYYQRIEVPSFTITDKIQAIDIKNFYQNRWLAVHPQHHIFASGGEAVATPHNKAIHIVAHWDSASGLTQNAIMSVKAFAKAGISVTKLYPSGEIFFDLSPIEVEPQVAPIAIEQNILILHVNADEAPEALAKISKHVDLDTSHIVGFYLWELEEVPKAHHLGLELVDEIWTPTEFVYSAYQPLQPNKVKLVKKALQVPNIVKHDRKKFGIPEDSFAFLLSFDYHSCTERKNPVVAVEGFLQSFARDENVTLVVKTTEFSPNHWGDPFLQWQAVQALAEADSRIVLIEDFLENDDFFALINSCDAVVSTHRAEGFGYLPAYAIWLGKSVIVTDYSGTTDFCTQGNSHLIEYNLVPIPAAKFVYPMVRPMWAEVKIESLITQYQSCKRMAHTDKTGEIAKIKDTYSFDRLATTYIERLVAAGAIAISDPLTGALAELQLQA